MGPEEEPKEESQDQPRVGFLDIPEIFYSDLTNQPLESCVMCDKNLLNGFEPYVIEKAFRYYPEYDIHNTIFENIMCLSCGKKVVEGMSKDSMQKIQQYFEQANLIQRKSFMLEHHRNEFDPWIEQCVIKKTPRTGMEEYQICGQFIGDQLILDTHPYMLSHEASSEIMELLSPETLDEYNRFVDDFFGLPPAFKKALKGNPALLV